MNRAAAPDSSSSRGGFGGALRQRIRARGALTFAVGLALTDISLRLVANGYENPRRWGPKDAVLYALGLAWSMATWSLYTASLRRLSARPALAGSIRVLMAVSVAVLFASSFAYLKNFDQAPSWQVLQFIVSEPKWLIRLGSWGLRSRDGVAAVAIVAAAWWLLAPPPLRVAEPPRARLGLWRRVLRPLAYLTLTGLVLVAPDLRSPLPVDTNTAAAIVQYALAQTRFHRRLAAPVRPELPKGRAASRPNILVLLHESLRADVVFKGLDYANTSLDAARVSPYQSALAARRADGFFVFPLARSNSTATESSVPSILSGVELGGPIDAYSRAQSLWSVGKASGAQTFLFAAEAYSWSHFDEYFLDGNVDRVLTGTDLSEAVPSGSTAADDGAVVDSAIRHLEGLAAAREPFVGAIHFDATHLPGWAGPGTPPFKGPPGDTERYGMAVKYIDGLVERVMQALERLGLDGSTVVLATSDHGENLVPRRPPDRLGSYYEPTLRIPFWIRVPPSLLATHPEWGMALDAWRRGNVQNMDLLPTVRDLLGLGDEPLLNPPHLTGRSLVRGVPGPDLILGQSTCAFRAWALEGFFLVRGRIKVIVSNDQPTPQIYDLPNDPREQKNLWDDPTWRTQATGWIDAAVRAGEDRLAVCRRIGRVCPVRMTPDANPGTQP